MIRLVAPFVIMLASAAFAQTNYPVIAVHVEQHADRSCTEGLPLVYQDELRTTYEGVGKIDAFVILYNFGQLKGVSFGMRWPEVWGYGDWHECGDLTIGEIHAPGDVTSIVWEDCKTDSLPLVIGWLTLTVSSPGKIEATISPKDGTIAFGDCNEQMPGMSEVLISLKAGAGGAVGDDPETLRNLTRRNWYVRPDSSGDAPTINDALRVALPGDTVFVAAGRYQESIVLRQGVVTIGSWDRDFRHHNVEASPSIIDASGEHNAVAAAFGQDSTTVLVGFVITGAAGRYGGGIALRNSSSPSLVDLIIHSNSARLGAGIFCTASSPVIRNCLIARNEADSGGGIYCVNGSSPVIFGVTLVENSAEHGSAVVAMKGSCPSLDKCIIALEAGGEALYSQDTASKATLSCCNLWSNPAGDFAGGTAEIVSLRDNISEDPLFTDPAGMDFTLMPTSSSLNVANCGRLGSTLGKVPRQ